MPLGGFSGAALLGGVTLYLAGYLLFKRRMDGVLSLPRLVTICLCLAALPAAVVLPPLTGLAGLVVLAGILVAGVVYDLVYLHPRWDTHWILLEPASGERDVDP
jgi:Bacterial low temperature requirement A protein (LtrA)